MKHKSCFFIAFYKFSVTAKDMQIKIRANHPFFRRINELMRHETQTIYQTSSKIGIRRDLLKAYMDGKAMPSVEKLELIADYFQVSVDYLLGRE